MNAVKTHEINLSTTAFNRFASSDYIILKSSDININDYILFKQVETVDTLTTETGLYRMTQVKEVIKDEGLQPGYLMLIVRKL